MLRLMSHSSRIAQLIQIQQDHDEQLDAWGNIEQLWRAAPAAVMQALSAFVTNVADLATKATTIVTEYGQGILAITQRASELRPPDDAPRSISEPDNWTVNEANR
jgi:hypothetical protein